MSSLSSLASMPPVTFPANRRSESKSELMDRFWKAQPLKQEQPPGNVSGEGQQPDNMIRIPESLEDIMAKY